MQIETEIQRFKLKDKDGNETGILTTENETEKNDMIKDIKMKIGHHKSINKEDTYTYSIVSSFINGKYEIALVAFGHSI